MKGEGEGASSPVVPQQPNQRLGDDADFRFGCEMPVELSDGHHHLKHSKEQQTSVSIAAMVSDSQKSSPTLPSLYIYTLINTRLHTHLNIHIRDTSIRLV